MIESGEQYSQACSNLTDPAGLLADILGFPASMDDLCAAYFCAVKGWGYWADFPHVDTIDFSGVALSFTPGSMGATVAGTGLAMLAPGSIFADFVAQGRVIDKDAARAALVAIRPEYGPTIQEYFDPVFPAETVTPEPASVEDEISETPEESAVETVAEPEPSQAASDTPEPVLVAPVQVPASIPEERSHVRSRAGDTIADLATDYGVSQELFKRWNPALAEPIEPGTIIYLAP
jgi:LysM repeat protein